MPKKVIEVYAHWEEKPLLMGVLSAEPLRGKEVFSFSYDKKWLQSDDCIALDPDLQLYEGPQFLSKDNKPNFGLFLDSSPDRWGRVLMQRRAAAIARAEQQATPHLFESDYLLGVYDEHRMGALRFKLVGGEEFLSNDKSMAAPPWTSIRELEEISLRIEEDEAVDAPDYIKWLNMLIAPGSSIGGARPKASVIDPHGHLWIAKFPSKNDHFDVGAWELLANQLAVAAGVKVAEGQAKKFSSNYHTFLSKRFDRGKGRIHFASAMTLLGYTDGNSYQDGISYLEIAQFIEQYGADPVADLEELWRRIVFNICIANVDDHLRNHGFLLEPKGWKLSPAYDLNPVETGKGLSLNISEDDNALDLQLALSVIQYFRLSEKRANAILKEVKEAVSSWQKMANDMQISRNEQLLKSSAFLFK